MRCLLSSFEEKGLEEVTLVMKNPFKNNVISSNAAFTLVEMLTVIGIIGIMSAIAIPNLLNPEHKLKAAARDLMGDMQKTRSMAIKTNKEWKIEFDIANNKYSITTGSPSVTKKTVPFSGYAAGVKYGHGLASEDVSGDTLFPLTNTYTSDILSFNSKGMVNTTVSGTGELFVYLQYGEVTYAVGTGPTGVVKLLRWGGDTLKWQ